MTNMFQDYLDDHMYQNDVSNIATPKRILFFEKCIGFIAILQPTGGVTFSLFMTMTNKQIVSYPSIVSGDRNLRTPYYFLIN